VGDRLAAGLAVSGTAIVLVAPLAGWSAPLDEAPDEVFATRMLGDGVAIDPTGATLHAPCDGELAVIAAARHALTLRTSQGCEILLHVGIDSVGLAGEGFELLVPPGARVRAGDKLLNFDLDLVARRAKSALTPVIVSADGGWRVVRSTVGREVAVGEFLMEIAAGAPASAAALQPAGGGVLSRSLTVHLEHGIHARPAALLAAALKNLAADVRVSAHGRAANARSTVALMALGVRRADQIEVGASGPDAALALEAVSAALLPAGAVRDAPATRAPARVGEAVAPRATGTLPGVIASRGFAVGNALQLRRPELQVTEHGAGTALENTALDCARAVVRSRLQRRVTPETALPAGSVAAGEIAAAHLELLDDPELLGSARTLIGAGKSAGFAWRSAIGASADTLRGLADERLRERVDDLLDLETQVLGALAGSATGATAEVPAGAIVIARELLPSQLGMLASARVAGICMAAGGATSHASILAAAMGIPALVALGAEVQAIADGRALILDAERGLLEVDPAPARLAAARAQVAARLAQRAAEQDAAQRECRTRDGTRIEVFANVGSLAEAESAVRNGAEGCGLLRTEFLFLDRQSPPTEQEQSAQYQRIADALGSRPLTIRTLDAGGDKPIAYLPLPPEDNPALGLRGVRTSLAFPQLLRTQLRAVLAVRSAQRCRLLLPMITDVAEVSTVRALLDELCRELQRSEAIALGVMIETPAAALLAERLAVVADFLSIGTNDLTQYTLAMDRGHPQLAERLDALHPAVLRLIARAAEGARAHGRHAAVCGGLASEPLAAPLLVGLGVHELSAVPAVIPQLKACLAAVSLEECRALAAQALEQDTPAAVRALLARRVPQTQAALS
jgi:phosphoenolpyruvate-protein phosphotransferase